MTTLVDSHGPRDWDAFLGADNDAAAAELALEAEASGRSPLTLVTNTLHGAGYAIPHTDSLREALQSDTPMWVPTDTSSPDASERFVVLSKHRSLGLWERRVERIKSGGAFEERTWHERLTPWFAWRSKVTTTRVAGLEGTAETVGSDLNAVTVFTQRGRRTEVPELSDEEADSLRVVVARAKEGIALPEGGRNALDKAANAMRTLAFDERDTEVRYACAGWIEDRDGDLVFAAPAGSVDRNGPREDIAVVAPIGSSDGALRSSSLGSIRVDRIANSSAELGVAAQAIRSTLDITPTRMDIGVAVIGAIFSAPLMLSTRGVVFLQGGPGSGKSLEATIVSGFQTDERPDKNRLPISIPKSSKVGAAVITGWARGLVVVGDDWRVEGLSHNDERSARAATTALVQAGYGAAEEAKGTQQGGLRAGRVSQTTALVTGEIGPPDAAQTSRSIHLRIDKGDIDLAGPGNAYDRWMEAVLEGGANMFYSSYIHWLANRAEGLGGLVPMMREAEQVRRSWASARHEERASETVASIVVGWHYLREFLRQEGLESALPGQGVLDEAFDELVSTNLDVAENTSLGARLVETLSAMIQGGAGHLVSNANHMPHDATRWGWSTHTSTGSQNDQLLAMGPRLGWVSGTRDTQEDDRRVTISKQGLKVAWREVTGGQEWSPETAERTIAPFVELGDSGNASTKPRLVDTPERRTGYVMALETLGLALGDDTTPPPNTLSSGQAPQVAVHSQGNLQAHLAKSHGGRLDVVACAICRDHANAGYAALASTSSS